MANWLRLRLPECRGVSCRGGGGCAQAGACPEKRSGHYSATGCNPLLCDPLYTWCLNAKPPPGCEWFSIGDIARRTLRAAWLFYYFLLTEPLRLLYFTVGWNTLWYGRLLSTLLAPLFALFPAFIAVLELAKRLNEAVNPLTKADWKLAGPGRVFFVRPDSLLASLLWDVYLALSVFCASFLQFGTDREALMHTWHDTVTDKEYWNTLLDAADACRPLQLGAWDGACLSDVGPGIAHGRADLVCKISDSYLGIGDKVLVRGKDFRALEDVAALLRADPAYRGKRAIVSELIRPVEAEKLTVSSEGYSQVHSLDIVTMRSREGVRVLTALLWTDCEGWSSHSCQAGYLLDVESETVAASAAWYSPYFAKQASSLVGLKLPGLQDVCAKAVAAHAQSSLPWLSTVGWDAMLTDEGHVFFEGNVAAYRTPRRVFLTPECTANFVAEYRPRSLRGPLLRHALETAPAC